LCPISREELIAKDNFLKLNKESIRRGKEIAYLRPNGNPENRMYIRKG